MNKDCVIYLWESVALARMIAIFNSISWPCGAGCCGPGCSCSAGGDGGSGGGSCEPSW